MKKLGNALILGALAAVLLTAVGCKQAEELGTGDTGKWGSQGNLTGDAAKKTLVLTYSDKDDDTNTEIDWWMIADTDGTALAWPDNYTGILTTDPKRDTKEKTWTFTFEDTFFSGKETRDVVLYISMPKFAPKETKNAQPGDVDYRGTVTIKSGNGVGIEAKDYKAEVPPAGIYTIKNNEYGKGTVAPTSSFTMWAGTWHGDYKITGLTVLAPKNNAAIDSVGTEFTVVSSVSYDFSNNPIEEGESRSVIIPVPKSGEYYAIGFKQPDRFTETDKTNSSYEQQKNWIWVAKYNATKHTNTDRFSVDYDGKIDFNGDKYTGAGGPSKFAAPVVYKLIAPVPGEK